MHLWPTKAITESWRLPYLKNLERAVSQRRAVQQKLLESEGGANSVPLESNRGGESKLNWICRDLLVVFTCCFCCGACADEMDYYSSY